MSKYRKKVALLPSQKYTVNTINVQNNFSFASFSVAVEHKKNELFQNGKFIENFNPKDLTGKKN